MFNICGLRVLSQNDKICVEQHNTTALSYLPGRFNLESLLKTAMIFRKFPVLMSPETITTSSMVRILLIE